MVEKKGSVVFTGQQVITENPEPAIKHPKYVEQERDWDRIRDCMKSESHIKSKREKYLPRPGGMKDEFYEAYDSYIERAHYPQICSYALSGALGVIITKLPEFNVPKPLEYILKEATKDGITIQQLFMEIIIEILQSGKCPLVVDIMPDTNKFKFVRYNAEDFINWKEQSISTEKNLILGVLCEEMPVTADIFSHDYTEVYRVLHMENGIYASSLFDDGGTELEDFFTEPAYMGKTIDEIPLFIAGSINNSVDTQPIPLLSVANCSIEIYRKEADLANSEFLSCNPTLCMVGASNDDDLPNVVGSSVMIVLPDPQARIFYTETDTAALQHVKTHIDDLYEEAIRHGVAILDTRKGVESAEALRIRQATQSASIYSMYLSALNAIKGGLELMCKWAGWNVEDVVVDAPSALTYGIPDSNVIRSIVEGFGQNVVPLSVVHKYLVGSGLLDQTVSLEEYVGQLIVGKEVFDKAGLTPPDTNTGNDPKVNANGTPSDKPDDPDPDADGDKLNAEQKKDLATKNKQSSKSFHK
jgi:hypothetical protein